MTDEQRKPESAPYAVALFAIKPDPAQTVAVGTMGLRLTSENSPGVNNFFNETACSPFVTSAESPEDAERLGLERAKELYPEREGWRGHAARAEQIDFAMMLENVIAVFGNVAELMKAERPGVTGEAASNLCDVTAR